MTVPKLCSSLAAENPCYATGIYIYIMQAFRQKSEKGFQSFFLINEKKNLDPHLSLKNSVQFNRKHFLCFRKNKPRAFSELDIEAELDG